MEVARQSCSPVHQPSGEAWIIVEQSSWTRGYEEERTRPLVNPDPPKNPRAGRFGRSVCLSVAFFGYKSFEKPLSPKKAIRLEARWPCSVLLELVGKASRCSSIARHLAPMRDLGGRLQAGAPFLDAVERAWASPRTQFFWRRIDWWWSQSP